jgi:hypothetical protein
VAFLATVRAVVFFACPPAGNPRKHLDNAADCFTDIERLTGAALRCRRIAIASPSRGPIHGEETDHAWQKKSLKTALEKGLCSGAGRTQ